MSKLPFWAKIGLYYFVTYLLTGMFFALQMITEVNGEYFQFPQLGPALAAIVFILLEGNSIKVFFKDGLRFRLSGFILTMILVPIVFIILISIITTKLWGVQNTYDFSIFFIISTIIAAFCEEIGWRGYMLPKLQSRMSPNRSSIILGLLWGFWHVPKLLMGLQSFSVWFIGIMGLTFVISYIFNRTNGSVVAVTILHSVINLISAFFLYGSLVDMRVSLINSICYVLWAASLIIFGRNREISISKTVIA